MPSVLAAVEKGYTTFVVPEENANEIRSLPGITFYSLTNFLQLVMFLQNVSILQHEVGRKPDSGVLEK